MTTIVDDLTALRDELHLKAFDVTGTVINLHAAEHVWKINSILKKEKKRQIGGGTMGEWKDLPTMQDVAAAQAAGEEIEAYLLGQDGWKSWKANAWDASAAYRSRPRKQTKTVVLRRALLQTGNSYYSTIPSSIDYSTGNTFVMWLSGEEIVEVPA